MFPRYLHIVKITAIMPYVDSFLDSWTHSSFTQDPCMFRGHESRSTRLTITNVFILIKTQFMYKFVLLTFHE